ncbi:ATP-binding protein [Streptomyces sp. NPDC018693]|uniref:ATP-binding protein n=1 Tax=unclassified Streptomyces TaxID=2593676 RepID=UPI00379709C7
MQLEIRPDPAEVGRARKWARARLARSGMGDDEPLAETLALLVSELVTNAVVHTGRPAVLQLCLPVLPPDPAAGPVTVRLEVTDRSKRVPVPRCATGEATGGRGLALVDGLADRWGWNVEGAGKRIWCELDRCGASGASGPSGAATADGGSVGRPEAAYGSYPSYEGCEEYEGLACEAV